MQAASSASGDLSTEGMEDVIVAAEAAGDTEVEWSCPVNGTDDIQNQIDFRLTLEMFNYVAAEKLLAFAMGLHPRSCSSLFALPRLIALSALTGFVVRRLGATSPINLKVDTLRLIGAFLFQQELHFQDDNLNNSRITIAATKHGMVAIGFWSDRLLGWGWVSNATSKLCGENDIPVIEALHHLKHTQNLRYTGCAKAGTTFGFSCEICVYLGTLHICSSSLGQGLHF